MSGSGLFVATLWLVVRGGERVGPHLNLLNNYFPGYSVSVTGAFLGFIYAFLVGALAGWLTATVYNLVAGWRQGGSN